MRREDVTGRLSPNSLGYLTGLVSIVAVEPPNAE